MVNQHVLIFGSSGAIGKACVGKFKASNWWICCINYWKSKTSNEENEIRRIKSTHLITNPLDNKYLIEDVNNLADLNILVDSEKHISEQEADILDILSKKLRSGKLNSIICLAGGYMPGDVGENLSYQMEMMWKQNVWPAIITVSIATKYLKKDGFLCLPGAKAALDVTQCTTMVGYGITKSAIHQLTRTLGKDKTGLPSETTCIGLLPITIDSIINKRATTPANNVSEWTPTKYISDVLFKWSSGTDKPDSGCCVLFNTKNFITDMTFIK